MKKKENEGEVKNSPPKPEIPTQMRTGKINILDLDPLDAEACAHGRFPEDPINGC